MLSPVPLQLSYTSSFKSLQKREVYKVFVAHFPGRRALASERDGLVFRTGLTVEGGYTIRWSRGDPFLQMILGLWPHHPPGSLLADCWLAVPILKWLSLVC